ncbi:MAG: transposase family protein [Planctomycetales bacterium]|nr:transposase family protein [Planctomycetales bacterium]
MNEVNEHYRSLLELGNAWTVDSVQLDKVSRQVVIHLSYARASVACPRCGQPSQQAGFTQERQWRHLNVMRFPTEIRAAVPQARCAHCGVRAIDVPWSRRVFLIEENRNFPIGVAYIAAPLFLLVAGAGTLVQSDARATIIAFFVVCGLICAATLHAYVRLREWLKQRRR